MKDKEAVEIWAAIDQISLTLDSLNDALDCLIKRDRSMARIYQGHVISKIGRLGGLSDAFWRNREHEKENKGQS